MKNFYSNKSTGCGTIIALFLGIIGLTFFFSGIGWLLWGAIAVGVFGLPVLSYWQFWGLYILCNILLGSIRTRTKTKRED